MGLTRRQKQVLDFLVGFINKRGYSPSFEEIGDGHLPDVHNHCSQIQVVALTEMLQDARATPAASGLSSPTII